MSEAHGLRIESLRLTVFLAPSVHVEEPTWWADLTGSQPETRNSRPGRRELQEGGTFQGHSLVLSVQPGRIDWIMAPTLPPLEGEDAGIRSIGRFPEALDLFARPMAQWLETCPEAIRIAFGAVLLEPVPDRVAGYRSLSNYLATVRIDPEGSQDFFYQINRPRRSTVAENRFSINRLSKWSVASFQRLQIAGTPSALQMYPGGNLTACRIEVDISTPAELQESLPHGSLGPTFREIIGLGSEIATQGDIP